MDTTTNRPFVFGLRTLLIVVALCGVGMLLYTNRPQPRDDLLLTDVYKLRIGMTESDVRNTLGPPHRTKAGAWIYSTDGDRGRMFLSFKGRRLSRKYGMM